MATEYTLRRADGHAFGTFEQVESRLRELLPTVQFAWTTSGQEKIKMAEENGITLPPQLMEVLPTLPSLREGVAEGNEFHVTFGLGHQEPVECLYVTPRGNAKMLQQALKALESDAESEFSVQGG